MLKCKRILIAALLLGAWLQTAGAQTLERKDIKIGIGGVSQLIYLPATLALRLGYFKEEGLSVELNDFAGGAKSLQALVGGSVDIIAGAYDGILRLQAKNQDLVGITEYTRTYGATLGVRTEKAAGFNSMADLKGMKVAVTAPGSGTQMMVQYLMAKGGLNNTDASFIGVGAGPGAVAAMQKGEIDAISNLDPVMTKLEALKVVKVIAETRTVAGNKEVFGGPMPGIALSTTREFIRKNPNTVQAVVNAMYKTLKWIDKATPEQIVETVPPEFYAGDRAGYLAAVKATYESYSRDGIVPKDGHQRSLDFLKRFEPEYAKLNIEVGKAFDDRFIKKAAATLK